MGTICTIWGVKYHIMLTRWGMMGLPPSVTIYIHALTHRMHTRTCTHAHADPPAPALATAGAADALAALPSTPSK